MPTASKEELLKYQEEIKHFYKMRKLFLGIGWACIGAGLIIGIPIAIGVNMELGVYFCSFSIVAGIIFFVLRGALFNRRIKSRKLLIKQAKEEFAIESMYQEDGQNKE